MPLRRVSDSRLHLPLGRISRCPQVAPLQVCPEVEPVFEEFSIIENEQPKACPYSGLRAPGKCSLESEGESSAGRLLSIKYTVSDGQIRSADLFSLGNVSYRVPDRQVPLPLPHRPGFRLDPLLLGHAARQYHPGQRVRTEPTLRHRVT